MGLGFFLDVDEILVGGRETEPIEPVSVPQVLRGSLVQLDQSEVDEVIAVVVAVEGGLSQSLVLLAVLNQLVLLVFNNRILQPDNLIMSLVELARERRRVVRTQRELAHRAEGEVGGRQVIS